MPARAHLFLRVIFQAETLCSIFNSFSCSHFLGLPCLETTMIEYFIFFLQTKWQNIGCSWMERQTLAEPSEREKERERDDVKPLRKRLSTVYFLQKTPRALTAHSRTFIWLALLPHSDEWRSLFFCRRAFNRIIRNVSKCLDTGTLLQRTAGHILDFAK